MFTTSSTARTTARFCRSTRTQFPSASACLRWLIPIQSSSTVTSSSSSNSNSNNNNSNNRTSAAAVTTRTPTPTPTQRSRSYMSTQPLSMAAEDDSTMLLILGKPGGGKGTISGKLLQDFPQFHHVSTGDLLRQHVRDPSSSLGKQAKSYMDAGKMLPDQLMIDVLMANASTHMEEGNSLLLDGFPRNLKQARALDEVARIGLVVNLDVPTDTIVERIADRWIHPASGRIYSYSYSPPKVEGLDDVTGEPLIQRDDDKPESVRTRLQAYERVTAPLVDYYEQRGVLKTFTGTMSDVIYPQVKTWLRQQNL